MFADVTFVEQDQYFNSPYLQGEKFFIEDKDKDLFLLEFPTLVSHQSEPNIMSNTPSEPNFQLEAEPNSPKSQGMLHGKETQDSTRPLQAYSRKRAPIPQPVQVQSSNSASGSVEVITQPNDNITETLEQNDYDVPIAIRKGTRTCTKHPLHLFMSYQNLSHNHKAFLTSLNTVPIPKTLSEALENENWKNPMKVAIEALEKNKTWDLVRLPRGKKPVGCRWVFTTKYNLDGSLERYKARLVPKGYT